eukprot:Rhum_TRINITY_DN11986_c0_g1::Rhum_TRINITY_DN11986_c0_g1_i1::g.48379::m.48379
MLLSDKIVKGIDFILGPCFRRAIVPSDSPETIRYKKLMLTVTFACLFATTFNVYTITEGLYPLLTFSSILTFFAFVLVYLLVFQGSSKTPIEVTFIPMGTVCIVAMDLYALQRGLPRPWPLFVVQIDILLVLRMSRRGTIGNVIFVVLYLAFTQAASSTSMAMDLNDPMAGHVSHSLCDCPSPPCKVSDSEAFKQYLPMVMVFLLDYYVTRGFAAQVWEEEQRMRAAIGTAQDVAASLARFDLDLAQEMLSQDGELPAELYQSFSTLLTHLGQYRPYLPDALFSVMHPPKSPSAASLSVSPPGVETNFACIVFTDVVGSTPLWLSDPDAMSKALHLHNSLIREAIRSTGGYEVKTIGDAFMVAFETLSQGVAFALLVQKSLSRCTWPAGLLRFAQCMPDPAGVWGGLTLRIGVNSGTVNVEWNPVTSRADYFGTTVNVASRVEGASAVGGVTLLAAQYEKLQEEAAACPAVPLPQWASTDLGQHTLRGMDNAVKLVTLFPAELEQRRHGRAALVVSNLEESTSTADARSSMHSSGTRAGTGVSPMSSLVYVRPPFAAPDLRHVAAATVATVEIAMEEEWGAHSCRAWEEHTSFLLACAERCHGKVGACVGRAVFVSWNVSTECLQHLENCFIFYEVLHKSDSAFAVGCSTGDVTVGTLGRGSQRFVNISGACVSLSRRLAEVARLSSTWACLYSNFFTQSIVPTYLRDQMRVSQLWASQEGTSMRDHIVWELQSGDLDRAGSSDKGT